jgi:hypothetical protein
MDEHKLIGNTLYVEREPDGTAKGIIGRCTCGWNTGYRFTSLTASAAFQDHQEQAQGEQGR